MSDFTTLAPRVMLFRAWIWMESNGWYVVGALALWFAVIGRASWRPLRAARSTAHAPSAAARDYEEGMRAARERQEAAASAQEAHAEHERERRARQAEELGSWVWTSLGWTQARARASTIALARRAQAET